MKKIQQFQSLWWLIPFIAFSGGYFFTRSMFSVKKVAVPRLVGLSLEQGLQRASDAQLSVQIIAEKPDIDLQPGTIISQRPLEHQIAREHQVIYIVIAQRPPIKKTPTVQGHPLDQAIQELSKASIAYQVISLPLQTTSSLVIAQAPAPQEPLVEPLRLYTSHDQQWYILPDFTNQPLADVLSFLEKHKISAQVTYQETLAPSYCVDQQRPLAGTLISLNNSPTIQLLAKAAHYEPSQI
jgi:beta-lactam-binding protein with PASTA domain